MMGMCHSDAILHSSLELEQSVACHDSFYFPLLDIMFYTDKRIKLVQLICIQVLCWREC